MCPLCIATSPFWDDIDGGVALLRSNILQQKTTQGKRHAMKTTRAGLDSRSGGQREWELPAAASREREGVDPSS